MEYIYLPAAYYHLHLDVTKGNLLAAGFSAVPAVFLVKIKYSGWIYNVWGNHLTDRVHISVTNTEYSTRLKVSKCSLYIWQTE